MKRCAYPILFLALSLCIGCRPAWTARERQIISTSDSLMYVTTIQADSAILRTPSVDLGSKELSSPELHTLIAKMLHTVTDPSQDGVGIAAPQVGINRRVILVQRFDKPGEPFEGYVNIRVDSLAGDIVTGPEGCLSVPGMRGLVKRHSIIGISYTDISSKEHKTEEVEGFTAVIFQHECDHLDGILYIDKADSLFVSD
ncbi:MAG: peptide deformylase [Bacteroidales bacterium]|nr:peptide deformylase [Bacteroidales bacterium]